MSHVRLGINIDHVATVRNARGDAYPDPVRAALVAALAGADGITAHLREDRRHITDHDIERLKVESKLPLNMEMAATEEMLAIARRVRPNAVCLVPEKREELTTEGGLDVVGQKDALASYIERLRDSGSRISLFVDANEAQIRAAHEVGADIVELHTGAYCHKRAEERELERKVIVAGAVLAEKLGMECHAGHGLSFSTVGPIAAIESIKELNIGHFIVGEAIFLGLEGAIRKMRELMDQARKSEAV